MIFQRKSGMLSASIIGWSCNMFCSMFWRTLELTKGRFSIFMLTVRMERSGVAILLLQDGWQINPSTATFTTSRVEFATGASALRRRRVTCYDWQIASRHGIIPCTAGYGNEEQRKVRQTSGLGMSIPVSIFSGISRALLVTFRNLTCSIQCKLGC